MTTATFADPLRSGYIIVFGTAAAICFLSVFRAERIDDDEIRRGLIQGDATTDENIQRIQSGPPG